MIPPSPPLTHPHAPSRPAFALAFVLLLLLVSSVMIAAGLARTNTQARVSHRRLDGYHEYHELMSIVDTVSYWMTRIRTPAEVLDMARDGGENAVIRLSDDLRLELRVTDAQGAVLARLDRAPDQERQDWMIRALESFGPEVERDTRKAGPFAISFNAASPAVLRAVADGDDDLYAALLILRAKGADSPQEFERDLTNEAVSAETARHLANNYFTFSPTILRIDAVLHSPYAGEEQRYYTLLLELRGQQAYFYEWKKLKSLPASRHVPLESLSR